MHAIHIKVPTLWRRTLYTTLLTSWCSGIAFFIFSRWIVIEGEFGPEKHPLQYPLLKIHGAAAMLMMVFYGAMLAGHVAASWKVRQQRPLGLSIIVVSGFMIVSAYLLYYLSDEQVRGWVANIHAASGVMLPVILAFHIISVRRNRGS